ncbi:MAG: MCP four helix bundle domain-containing protein [Aureliella sp.]
MAAIAFFFTVVYLRGRPGPAEQIALKAHRLELVHAVRVAVAAVSEAQNGAIMANADEDTRYFIARAQAAATYVDSNLKDLDNTLKKHGNQRQLELMNRVKQAIAEFERLDKQLLELASQNSNRKAYALATGPAAKHLKEMNSVLAHIAATHRETSSSDRPIDRLADETRIAVLQIQVLLLPHIAEEDEKQMDELESQIAREDQKIEKNLDALTALLAQDDPSDVDQARALYADFKKTRAQIISLSRKNTNVRSIALALNEKRKAMLAVEDALGALRQAVESEKIITTIPQRQ